MAEKEKVDVRPQTRRTHPWAFPLGLGIALLAIVGAITLLSFGIKGIKFVTNQDGLKYDYAVFLKNVVRNDPSPFDDISKADMSQLLDSAVWELINKSKEDLAKGKYMYSESEPIGYRLPQEEVEFCFVRLFGNEVKPLHDDVFGVGYTFFYDAATKTYTIPATDNAPIYVPKVHRIDKKGSSIILTVGYSGYGEWDVNDIGWNIHPEPVKFMKITLRERKTDTEGIPAYYVGALQATDASVVDVSTIKMPDKTEPETTLIATTDGTSETGETDDTGESAETDDATASTD